MAYNTVSIQKDVDGKPIPQYYNILQDVYEVLQGRNGANRVELFDASGNAVDVVALVAGIIGAVTDIYNKDTTKTLYGLSTDSKPTINRIKGDKFFEINTGEVYMWDGSDWVVI